jgi:hypothetical protein
VNSKEGLGEVLTGEMRGRGGRAMRLAEAVDTLVQGNNGVQRIWLTRCVSPTSDRGGYRRSKLLNCLFEKDALWLD